MDTGKDLNRNETVSILLIEDEATIRKNYRRILEKNGCKVFEAVDGEQGIQTMTRTSVNLVITDLQLPGVSGIEVIQYLTQAFPWVKIIAMTAGIPTLLEKAKEHGAHYAIKKSFDTKELVSIIKEVLSANH